MANSEETFFLRSLGYLCIPNAFKKRFGITTKKKFRLKIFPEPMCEITENDNGVSVVYTFLKKDIEEYESKIKTGEVTNE